MKTPRLALACIFAIIACLAISACASLTRDPIEQANARLGRGINLGNALDPRRESGREVTLQSAYFSIIRQAGFDSVRLPVCWSAHALTTPPYTIDPVFLARVDWAVDQAVANHLNIIINVHNYDEMETDPDANLPRLEAIWSQIARHFKDRPASVYFELFNEPNGQLTDEKWNAIIPRLLAVIRPTNPTRAVVVGPVSWNSINALDSLQLPATDQHLIVTVHYYDPMRFTHQGASWIRGADKWPRRDWTGTTEEQAPIRAAFDRAALWSRQNNRPIFLGEFGAYSERADMASRARWTHFVATEATRHGFSWAYWEFCAGFGAFDPKAMEWRAPLKDALVSPE